MKTLATSLAVLLWATAGLAGPPRIESADLRVTELQDSLARAVEAWSDAVTETSWLGWHVPMVATEGTLCCWSRSDRRWQERACTLESSHRHLVFSSDRPVFADGENLVVLVKASAGVIDGLRIYSDSCLLEAGGGSVSWLENVEPRQSVALMSRWVEAEAVVEEEALMALALHAEPAAATRLADFARRGRNADLRGEALFWLSQTGTGQASEIILEALEEDPDPEVREKAIFALSQLPGQQGVPMLLQILQDPSRSKKIREEAFFWYVQSGDDEALDLIAEILTNQR